MAVQKTDLIIQKTELELYPEEYLLEEDEMGESNAQYQLIKYLAAVLEWLFHVENWLISGNLELYNSAVRNSQNKITPDLIVFKGIIISPETRQALTSWMVGFDRTPPVIFEISSQSTWRSDVMAGSDNKPAIYGRLGVKEYFAYDPNEPQVWRATRGRRLVGWRYENGLPVEILPDGLGRIWSNELNSWLVPDGPVLRLYDQHNNLRLTEAESSKKEGLAKDLTIESRDELIAERDELIAELRRQLRESRGESTQE